MTEKLYDRDAALMTSPSPKSHLSAKTVCLPSENNTKHCCSPTNKKRNYEGGSVFCVIGVNYTVKMRRCRLAAAGVMPNFSLKILLK